MRCSHHFMLLLSALQIPVDTVKTPQHFECQVYLHTTTFHLCFVIAYPSCQNKQKAMNFECHAFKAQWNMSYFVIELDGEALFIML